MARPQSNSNPYTNNPNYRDVIDRLNSILPKMANSPACNSQRQELQQELTQAQTQQKKGQLTAMDFYKGVGFNKGYIEPNTIKD